MHLWYFFRWCYRIYNNGRENIGFIWLNFPDDAAALAILENSEIIPKIKVNDELMTNK